MSAAVPGRREERRRATGLALRRAGLALFAEQGYSATSTEQIARAAGVSPRTFFNYFETKEALFFLPDQPLVTVVTDSIASRPPGEDPVRSVAVAAMDLFRMVEAAAEVEPELGLASLRLMLRDPDCRRFLEHRRDLAERSMWQALIDRGVAREDLACRTSVAAVVAAGWVALAEWAEREGTEPLTGLLARCLLGLPEPARLAAGVLGELPRS